MSSKKFTISNTSSPRHTNDLKKYISPAPQLELVIMSLSKGNAAYTLYNGPPNKGGMIKRAGYYMLSSISNILLLVLKFSL